MSWTPLICFAVIMIMFGIGDIVSAKTKGIVNSVLVVIILTIIFGGTMGILPADLYTSTGLIDIIGTFGMGLILTGLGSMLNINDLKREWKTVIVSLAAVAGVVALQFSIGAMLFGKESAYAAAGPTTGGMAATMILSSAANEAGRADVASLVAAVMALQMLIGMPIASFCLRKEALRFVNNGEHKLSGLLGEQKNINIRIVPQTPAFLNTPQIHLARLSICAICAVLLTGATGIAAGVTYLIMGILFGALGFVEPGALRLANSEGILMIATFASICTSFASMSLGQFGAMLGIVVGLLVIGAAGVIIFSSIVGKILGWNPMLSIAVGICCMIGYPGTYSIATEISNGIISSGEYSEEEKSRIINHLLPKMIVSGTVSVSIASVVLAGIVAPMLFA